MLAATNISAQLVQCDATGASNTLVSCDLCDLVGTVNVIFEYAVAFLAAAAVLMLIVGGIRYVIASGNQSMIEQAKKTIQFAIIGLVIVVLSFVIVGSILNMLGYKADPFGQVACDLSFAKVGGAGPGGGQAPPPSGPPPGRPGQEPTGPGATGQWADLINEKARERGINPCAMQVIVGHESGGKQKVIGHDGHSSRNDPFQEGNPPFHNLNWSYSHGIGLTQTTIFPKSRRESWAAWRDSNTPSRKVNSTWYTVADLLDPSTNLDAGSDIFAEDLRLCNGDYYCAFGNYNGGKNFRKNAGKQYADNRYKEYQQCQEENKSTP